MSERDGDEPGVTVPEARTQTREAPVPSHRGGAESTVSQLVFDSQGA